MEAKHPILKIFYLVLICTVCTSCASMNIRNIEDAANFQPETDEKGIWEESARIQKSILNSNYIYSDNSLEEYINQILNKVVGQLAREKDVTLKAFIVKDPNFNALTFPNGVIFVHIGLLANLDNEAQLATILGHEAIHFLHRHTLKQHRTLVNLNALLVTAQVVSVGTTYGVAYAGYDPRGIDLIRQYVELGTVGSIFGYSRDLEREADDQGFKLLKQAGYDPRESKKAFENLYEISKEEKLEIPYFYQTHPKTKERINNFEKYLKNLSKTKKEDISGIINQKEYMQHIKEILAENILLDIKRSKKKIARKEIDKFIKNFPDDCRGSFFEAKLLIADGKSDEAVEKLLASLEKNQNFDESNKEIGLLYYKKGEKEKSAPYFRKYLELNPVAKDKEYIRRYLNE